MGTAIDGEASGSIGTYVVEQFDDMRASVNYVGSFARVFADPRMVSYHAGGHVHTNVSITGSRPPETHKPCNCGAFG